MLRTKLSCLEYVYGANVGSKGNIANFTALLYNVYTSVFIYYNNI